VDLHIVIDRQKPLRAQIERQLRDGIAAGRLKPGVQLPPSRLLAPELGVSRGVVVEAYAQLTAEGYLVTQGSGGTRVAAVARPMSSRRFAASRPLRFDLRSGLPDPSLFPRRAWGAASLAAGRELPDAELLYGPAQGQRRLREVLTAYLGRTRAIVAEIEDTFITCGTSHALGTVWQALKHMGVHAVAHEDPAWQAIPATIAQAGLRPIPVRVEDQGLSLAELYSSGAQAVVVSPAYQYPTGVTMHPTRRLELLRWARETGGLIVEDDYDAEYRFRARPLPPLRSIERDRVIYIGSTSKVLAPALRLGWLLVPPSLTPLLAEQHEVSYAKPSVLDQAAFAGLVESGELDRHLRKARGTYRARRAALLSSLTTTMPSLRISGGAAGLHLLVWLPRHLNEDAVVASAAQGEIAIDGLHTACGVSRRLGPALILGYGGIVEPAIGEAIFRLARCIEGCRAHTLPQAPVDLHAANRPSATGSSHLRRTA
jgi:GntR family transcriptional regulator/MocR family aminotransferase